MSWIVNKLKNKTRGFFESFHAVVPKQDRPDWMTFDFRSYCERFDEYANKYPKVKSCLQTIAGQSISDGVFITEADEYERAVEAKERCERFNRENCYFMGRRVNMNILAYETFFRMIQYGTAFWEKDFRHPNGLAVQLLAYSKYLTPVFSKQGELVKWEMRKDAQVLRSWVPEEIVVFPAPPLRNPPFGTSWLTGIDYELNTQGTIRKNLLAYLEKQAFASNVLQVGDGNYMPGSDEVTAIETKVRNREVGEDFVTSYPTNLQVMGAAQIETRMIPEALEFTDTQITDALNSPPISKLYNSTEASATVMTDWNRAITAYPLQRVFSNIVETEVYEPFLVDLGYSSRVFPSLAFDPPDVHTKEEADYHLALVQGEIETPEQAAKKLGIDWDKAYWDKQRKEKEEQMKMQPQNGEDQQGKDDNEKRVTEEYLVRRLKHEHS